MKKIFSTLALSALVCASASAAKVANTEKVQAPSPVVSYTFDGTIDANVGVKKAPAKKSTRAASVNDFVGFFGCDYIWPFSGDDPKMTCTIKQIDGNMVEVVFNPYNHAALVGTIDPAKGTLTIPVASNQNLYTYDQYGSLGMVVYVCVEEDGAIKRTNETKSAAVGTLNADGTISFPPLDFIGFEWSSGDGFNFAMIDLTLVAPDFFKYNEAEWKDAGTVQYQEWLINPIVYEQYRVAESPCTLKQSTTQPGLWMLYGPYAAPQWEAINDGDAASAKNGGLVLDLSFPGCVAVRPLTGSGMTFDYRENENDAPDLEEFYFYNLEGVYHFTRGFSLSDIADAFEEADYNLSTYDRATGVVRCVNMMFGQTSAPDAGYVWQNDKELWFQFTLPEGVDSVDGINADSDVASRYFNLQGVEVANPEKGELVIVKKGNKASKVIF